MKQYLVHYHNCKAADNVVKEIHTSAILLLPKWSILSHDTKNMVLLKEFPVGFSLFVDKAGNAIAPLSTAFQLWYGCPTTLFHANNKLLGENWNCKDRPAVTVNISTAAPKLTMLFNGMLAGIPAVILADSGASHVIIDQPFALHHQLNIRPCPYASANLASGVSVG